MVVIRMVVRFFLVIFSDGNEFVFAARVLVLGVELAKFRCDGWL